MAGQVLLHILLGILIKISYSSELLEFYEVFGVVVRNWEQPFVTCEISY